MLRYRKAQTEAVLVSCEKRIENPCRDRRGDTPAMIPHPDDGALVLDPRRYIDLSASGTCLNGVHRQIQQRLPDQLRVTFERWKIGGNLRPEEDEGTVVLGPRELDHLF